MYNSIDIVDILGSTIYVKRSRKSIQKSELRKIVGYIETHIEYMHVDYSRHKINVAGEMLQVNTQTDIDVVVLPRSDELRRRFVLKYFQLDKDIRQKLEQIISETLEP